MNSAELLPALSESARASVLRQLHSAPAPSPHTAGSIARTTKRHVTGQMNATERRYADSLDAQKIGGFIRSWKFERMNLRVDSPGSGRAMTYRPDFIVWHADGRVTFDEVKNRFIREAGMVKFRAAVEVFPEFHFRMWQWADGAWRLLRESQKP